jgi:hypothetical protein
MSLINKIAGPKAPQPQPQYEDALTKQDIEVLLTLIRQSSFQGESLELLYNLVLKLQNQYVSLDK